MTLSSCVQCDDSVMKSTDEVPFLCSTCRNNLTEEINRIDRNSDRYTKRGKLRNRLSDIPDEAIPKEMALMIEEVADPEVEDRQYKLGNMEEIKKLDDNEIHSLNNDLSEKDRGKIVLKKRYR